MILLQIQGYVVVTSFGPLTLNHIDIVHTPALKDVEVVLGFSSTSIGRGSLYQNPSASNHASPPNSNPKPS